MAASSKHWRASKGAGEILRELEAAKAPADFFDATTFNPFKFWDSDPKKLKRWLASVDAALHSIVDEHHKGFNTSTANFSHILSKFTDAQNRAHRVNEAAAEARRLLSARASDHVRELWMNANTYKHAVDILGRIERVAVVPETVRAALHAKLYLKAVVLLNKALLTLFDDELKDIGALKEIHADLLSTRNILQQQLLEELHRHIYIVDDRIRQALRKGPVGVQEVLDADSSQWKEEQQTTTMIPMRSDSSDSASLDEPETGLADLELEDVSDPNLRDLLTQENAPSYKRHPEADSRKYMAMLVHALNHLQRLPSARAALLKQLRPSIRDIVDEETSLLKASAMSTVSAGERSSWAAETLLELMERVFRVLTRVLDNHIVVCSQLNLLCHSRSSTAGPDADGYCIGRVWSDLQQEVWAMLNGYLQTQSPSLPHLPSSISRSAVATSSPLKLSFSFADSAVASVTKMSRDGTRHEAPPTQKHDEDNLVGRNAVAFISAAAEHVTLMYRPLIQFCDQALAMLGRFDSSSEHDNVLRAYFDNFVSSSFVPRVRADANFRVKDVFMSSNAFGFRDATRADHIEGEPPALLESAFAIAGIVERVFGDFFDLPYDQSEFISIVDAVLIRFLEKAQQKYTEVCTGVYSAMIVSEPSVAEILRKDPFYRREGPSEAAAAAFFKEESVIYYRLLHNLDRLDESQLLLDPNQWSLLGALAESLVWMVERVRNLANPLRQDAVECFTPSILTSYETLADKILFTLRLEFHCHSFYFFSGIFSSDYAPKVESTEPQQFVIDLNKDLMLADEKLSAVFSPSKSRLEHIFAGQPALLASIIIKAVSRLEQHNQMINKHGIRLMTRNVFALQQNLTNLVANVGTHLERARQYWELLREKNLSEFAQAHPQLYRDDEYKAIEKMQKLRSTGGSSGSRNSARTLR